MKIYLKENYSKLSSNEDSFINISLSSDSHKLPLDSITKKVNAYDEYFSENDKSDKYRLIFTINPVCTNILFNANTEVVYKEGSPECKFLSNERGSNGKLVGDDYGLMRYLRYKGHGAGAGTSFVRYEAIRDTGFSHPEAGDLRYHCGVDIFNNHLLRKREFSPISKLGGSTPNSDRRHFNSLFDFIRDENGAEIKEKIMKINGDGKLDANEKPLHVYTFDNARTFQKSISDNLIETDGWVGFINPVGINTANYNKISINKCMNDRAGGEQIDMYPGRELYSFIPIVNNYRRRLEKNWDYCITYPCEKYTNEVVKRGTVNGIRCKVITNLSGTVLDKSTWSGATINGIETGNVYLRTELRNTLQTGSYIGLTIINKNNAGVNSKNTTPIMVQSVGLNGEDTEHIFAIKLTDFFSVATSLNVTSFIDSDGNFLDSLEVRIRKNYSGVDCEYYFRKFKRVPNFNGGDVYQDGIVTNEDIKEYSNVDFNSTINKLAFSENIFSDKIAQIVFNDDIITTGLKDNLGRKLSEIYLTIVKRNAGYKEWYEDKNYSADTVEYSHCFGDVTSGLDLAPDFDNFNVHKIHNIKNPQNYNIQDSPSCLESGITINNDESSFLGDIVEFSITDLTETVIEKVYHRFNTAQREIYNSEFGKVKYDNIVYDDYDIDGNFTIEESYYGGENRNMALMPEGYYYQPHYKIQIREFEDGVKQGSDIKMGFSEIAYLEQNKFSGTTNIPYYLNVGDTIDIYDMSSVTRYNGLITKVEGNLYNKITFTANIRNPEKIANYFIYKKNPAKPNYAYELEDGSGRYLWKDVKSSKDMIQGDELYESVFTNGAHYFQKQINFYLRRQDPYGEYGLNTQYTLDYMIGASEGKQKDVSFADYVEENEVKTC